MIKYFLSNLLMIRPERQEHPSPHRPLRHLPVAEQKILFWIIVASGMALATIPSFMLLDALKDYFSFLEHWEVGVIKPIPATSLPHPFPRREHRSIRVRFVRFSISAREAKSVSLTGDFNQWDLHSLPLSRIKSGVWEVLVPLPPGDYHYLYVVDDRWTLDPKNSQIGYRGPQKTSVKTVR